MITRLLEGQGVLFATAVIVFMVVAAYLFSKLIERDENKKRRFMKTNEQIMERYLSDESADFFSAQKIALISLLPYEMAKPHLDPDYVKDYENGTLPEEEKWSIIDVEKEILSFLPDLYKRIKEDDAVWVMEGLMFIKSWIWATSDELYESLKPLYETDFIDCGKELADKIAKHYNYVPTIVDTEFEEIPAGEQNSAPEEENK